LKSGIGRAEGIKSIQECAAAWSDYKRFIDAAHFVDELCTRNDQDVSSAAANPIGLKLTLQNPIRNEDYAQFRKCFHFDTVIPTKPEPKLKLFQIDIKWDGRDAGEIIMNPTSFRNFRKGGMLLVTGTDEDSVLASLREEGGEVGGWLRRVEPERITISELPGPFKHVTVIIHQEF